MWAFHGFRRRTCGPWPAALPGHRLSSSSVIPAVLHGGNGGVKLAAPAEDDLTRNRPGGRIPPLITTRGAQ